MMVWDESGLCTGDPSPHPRAGWDEAFARMAAAGDDTLLDKVFSTSAFDQEDWEWPAPS